MEEKEEEEEKVEMIEHDCPVEGKMYIEKGKPCNWCDSLDEE